MDLRGLVLVFAEQGNMLEESWSRAERRVVESSSGGAGEEGCSIWPVPSKCQ